MVTTVFSKIILQCRKYSSRVKSCKFFMVQLITILFEKVKPFIKSSRLQISQYLQGSNYVGVFRPATLLRRDSNTVVFL